MNSWPTEYRRPWKVATLAAGIALLILGSFYYRAPGREIPIGIIMAILAHQLKGSASYCYPTEPALG